MRIGQCVPKRRHIKFRYRGMTQKKEYNKLMFFRCLEHVFRIHKNGRNIVGESVARKSWTKVRRYARMTLRVYWGTCDGSVRRLNCGWVRSVVWILCLGYLNFTFLYELSIVWKSCWQNKSRFSVGGCLQFRNKTVSHFRKEWRQKCWLKRLKY
jgi:hypothetical protein